MVWCILLRLISLRNEFYCGRIIRNGCFVQIGRRWIYRCLRFRSTARRRCGAVTAMGLSNFFGGPEGLSATPFWITSLIFPANPAPFKMDPFTSKKPDLESRIFTNSSRFRTYLPIIKFCEQIVTVKWERSAIFHSMYIETPLQI